MSSRQARRARTVSSTARQPNPAAPRHRRRSSARRVGLPVAVVVVAVSGLVLARLVVSDPPSLPERPATALVSYDVAHVPAAALEAARSPAGVAGPERISAPSLSKAGKPELVYVGAEFCPYCAAQRWALAVALSRFGTFSGLKMTESSTSDPTDPGTKTLSFFGSTYTSAYLSFTAVEETTNQPAGDFYRPLQRPTAAEARLLSVYDAPPYASEAGGIPFLDFGGRYLLIGPSYDPAVLSGRSWTQIADALSDPDSQVGRSINGAANVLSAVVCTMTAQRPGAVCGDPAVRSAHSALRAGS